MDFIFEGVAREGNLVAAACYSFDDFKNFFGDDIEIYKDYLLSRHALLEDLSIKEPARIVNVPFNSGKYALWLIKKKLKDSQKSRCAWALDVAKKAGMLSGLLNNDPIFPAAPVEEKISANVYYGIILAALKDVNEVQFAARKLSANFLKRVSSEI